MLQKLTAILAALRKGSLLQNPALWKNVQAATNGLALFLLALVAVAKAFGVEANVSEEAAYQIAGGIVAFIGVLNTYWTVATSDKVGLRPKDDGGSNLGGTEQPFLGD